MPRTKQKREIHHETDIHELLNSLESMPHWIDVLVRHSTKSYCPFMKWLNDNRFFVDRESKMTMKQLSKEYGQADAPKITKWIHEAYNDILFFHEESPDIFNTDFGIRQKYYIKYGDNIAGLTMWLPVVPRMYEEVRIPFLRAKIGIDFFWVYNVQYEVIETRMDICIWLRGGLPNPYREMLLQRAKFEGKYGLWDEKDKYDFEIDKELLEFYRK